MNLKVVGHTLGKMSLLLSLTLIFPLFISIIDHSPDSKGFFFTILLGIVLGLILSLIKHDSKIGRKEGFAIVGLTWIYLSALGAMPFFFSEVAPTYTDAFFESMAGFTTTGATILTDIESVPRGILFWRSLTQWLGGMGIIILSLAVFSFKGASLFQAEIPGHTPDRILPRLKQTAKTLWFIYAGLSLAEILLLKLAGLSLFDSLIHTFSTMSTGGFSSRNLGIKAYHNPYIETVIVLFMLLAGMNFSLHYRALQKKKLTPFILDPETKSYFGIISISTLIIMFTLCLRMNIPLATAFRRSIFQVVSIITTTVFYNDNFNLWPPLAQGILFLLMFVGSCTGSTSGSIKIGRLIILFKYARRRISKTLRPRQVMQTKVGPSSIPDSVIHEILTFFFLYIVIFAFGALVVMATGEEIFTSIMASAASIGNFGSAFGGVAPLENYASMHAVAKWTLCFLMLAGRLELMTILVLFHPGFWRK